MRLKKWALLLFLLLLPVAQSTRKPARKRTHDELDKQTVEPTVKVPGCKWEQMRSYSDLDIPVCIKIRDKSIVQPVEIKSYAANVKHYSFFVPVNTKLVCACPGSSFSEDQRPTGRDIKFQLGTNSFEAECIDDQNMRVHDRNEDDLGAYKCERIIEFGPRKIEDPRADSFCPKPYVWKGIGFDVNLGGIERFNLLEICYDEQKKRTIYVKHKWISGVSPGLRPPSKHWQGAKKNEEKKYSNQWHRGHLAPDADFPIYELKFLTYFYENAAPQYGPFNSVQWLQVEKQVRNQFKEATIFTGTSDLDLNQDKISQGMAKLNLATTDVNEWRPDFFWKIAFGTDKESESIKMKGYIYSNKIEPKSDSFLKNKIDERFLCAYKASVTAGYCFDGADVEQITDLLPEAKFLWKHVDFTDTMNGLLMRRDSHPSCSKKTCLRPGSK
ncbi:uncharacterized protein LOC135943523 [Cloeon dipterum]|uniref:uncharacterized protein LOC135943523 n=1 Tax=Cloeon dipterum TaxID=197152 RepID=UPI00321FBC8A